MLKRTHRRKTLDFASGATLFTTVVLFAIALIEKGLTHEILLEAGVFLVSVKLVIGSYENHLISQSIMTKLEAIDEKLERARNEPNPGEPRA